MKFDHAYEIVDRRNGVSPKLAPLGIVDVQQGTAVITDANLQQVTADINDDQYIAMDNGEFDIDTPKGRITFVPLTFESFRPLAAMLQIDLLTPPATDDDLAKQVFTIIADARS